MAYAPMSNGRAESIDRALRSRIGKFVLYGVNWPQELLRCVFGYCCSRLSGVASSELLYEVNTRVMGTDRTNSPLA